MTQIFCWNNARAGHVILILENCGTRNAANDEKNYQEVVAGNCKSGSSIFSLPFSHMTETLLWQLLYHTHRSHDFTLAAPFNHEFYLNHQYKVVPEIREGIFHGIRLGWRPKIPTKDSCLASRTWWDPPSSKLDELSDQVSLKHAQMCWTPMWPLSYDLTPKLYLAFNYCGVL